MKKRKENGVLACWCEPHSAKKYVSGAARKFDAYG
jgi:hypothetical protein